MLIYFFLFLVLFNKVVTFSIIFIFFVFESYVGFKDSDVFFKSERCFCRYREFSGSSKGLGFVVSLVVGFLVLMFLRFICLF